MVFDIICLGFYLLAIVKGIQRGLILAVFSFIGFILGLILSTHFCGYLAEWIKNNSTFESKWLIGIAFLVIFLAVLLVFRIVAKSIEAGLEIAMLGWLNKLGGVVFYLLLYTFLIGIIIQIMLLIPGISGIYSDSYFVGYIKDMIPWITDALQKYWPSFSHSFGHLKSFIN